MNFTLSLKLKSQFKLQIFGRLFKFTTSVVERSVYCWNNGTIQSYYYHKLLAVSPSAFCPQYSPFSQCLHLHAQSFLAKTSPHSPLQNWSNPIVSSGFQVRYLIGASQI
uniref:Uncharacterized protein n=1 Tax=Cacopsylla melanoneura TaxID=428564 RepID=A0A8D8V3Z1_9HEMI